MVSDCLSCVPSTSFASLTPLQDKTSAQILLETPAFKALARPTGPDSGQACYHQERSSHTLLSQRRLRHRPFLSMLHDQNATKEVLPFKKNQGTPALTLARCLSQTLWSSLPRLVFFRVVFLLLFLSLFWGSNSAISSFRPPFSSALHWQNSYKWQTGSSKTRKMAINESWVSPGTSGNNFKKQTLK